MAGNYSSLSFAKYINDDYPFKGDPHNYAYGDNYTAAKYCGFIRTPKRINGEWQHGHIVPERNIHPELVIGSDGLSRFRKQKRYYVARQDQVEYLRNEGFSDVVAVGLPILYTKKPNIKRIKGSLLIMPSHSLAGVDYRVDELNFINKIKPLLNNFDLAVCCIHRNDFDKGFWIETMRDIGIETIIGADKNDANAYPRLAAIFSQFEYMITDDFGSHLAYASYFGCKVSILPKLSVNKEIEATNAKILLESAPFYKNNPDLIDIFRKLREEIYPANYPFLFKNILASEVYYGWAAFQLGFENKKTPEELRILFGWGNNTIITNLKLYSNPLIDFTKKKMNNIIKLAKKQYRKYLIFKLKDELKIFTHLTIDEKLLLYKISKGLPKNARCAEIGSYFGASSCIIAKGLSDTGRLYCIDTWGNHAMIYDEAAKQDSLLTEKDTYTDFQKNTAKYRHKIIELRGWSTEKFADIKKSETHLDFLFIDGDHAYDSVLKDWELYSTLIKKNGLVAFHDTGWAEGVIRVIKEQVMARAELIFKLPNLQVYKLSIP
jgi:predicted O-methyltransferase YrrM